MLKDTLSKEKSKTPLTEEMVARIIEKNANFFKAKGLTPTGKPFSNQKTLSATLLQKTLGETK